MELSGSRIPIEVDMCWLKMLVIFDMSTLILFSLRPTAHVARYLHELADQSRNTRSAMAMPDKSYTKPQSLGFFDV